jgi:Domain of unknown function (DUF4351)
MSDRNPPTQFDSPWKTALEQYFPAFVQLCFPQVAEAIDWSKPHVFLDKELQKVVRDAELGKRFADKLIKVWLLGGEELWLLIHVEIQEKREPGFSLRMYQYNYRISDRYKQPVVSLAVLCDGNSGWRPTSYKWETMGCKIRFDFLMLKLLDYKQQWEGLEQSQNPFSIVIMAHLKAQETRRNQQQRKIWKFSLTRRLYEQGYPRQDILNLFHFIDWVMKLPDNLELEFQQELSDYEQENNMPYVTSIERFAEAKGREEGREEGRKEGQGEIATKFLVRMLQRQFQEVPNEVRARLQSLSVEQLERLIDVALSAESLVAFVERLTEAEVVDLGE